MDSNIIGQIEESIALINYRRRSNGKRRRLSGGGRKVKYVDEEAQIAEWVLDQREKALRVTYKYIAEKAKEIIEDPCFKASRWWVTTFIDRWGFSLRKKKKNHCWAEVAIRSY